MTKKIYYNLKDWYNNAPITIKTNLKNDNMIIEYKKNITFNDLVKNLTYDDNIKKYGDKKIIDIREKKDI